MCDQFVPKPISAWEKCLMVLFVFAVAVAGWFVGKAIVFYFKVGAI